MIFDAAPEETRLAERSLDLVHGTLDYLTSNATWTSEANTFASVLCLRRAAEQCAASLFLLGLGVVSEVPLLLRGAYESAGLARMLAHSPEDAERWLKDETWVPDRRVRQWLRDAQGDDFADDYRTAYATYSDMAHTTLVSCTVFLEEVEGSGERVSICPTGAIPANVDATGYLNGLAATGLFVFFCMRNATVDERVIPGVLREEAQQLAEALTRQPAPHLDRDWHREDEWLSRLVDDVPEVDDLDARLTNDPMSFDNRKPEPD